MDPEKQKRGSKPMFSVGEETKFGDFVLHLWQSNVKIAMANLLSLVGEYLEMFPRAKKASSKSSPSNLWFINVVKRRRELHDIYHSKEFKEFRKLSQREIECLKNRMFAEISSALTPEEIEKNKQEVLEKELRQSGSKKKEMSPRERLWRSSRLSTDSNLDDDESSDNDVRPKRRKRKRIASVRVKNEEASPTGIKMKIMCNTEDSTTTYEVKYEDSSSTRAPQPLPPPPPVAFRPSVTSTPTAKKTTRAPSGIIPHDAVPIHDIIYEVGEWIEALDRGHWWSAKIVMLDDNAVKVHFRMWAAKHDRWYVRGSLHLRGPTQSDLRSAAQFRVGESVLAPWKDNKRYPGKIESVSSSGNYTIRFFDGLTKVMRSKALSRLSAQDEQAAIEAAMRNAQPKDDPADVDFRAYKTSATDRERRLTARRQSDSVNTSKEVSVARATSSTSSMQTAESSRPRSTRTSSSVKQEAPTKPKKTSSSIKSKPQSSKKQDEDQDEESDEDLDQIEKLLRKTSKPVEGGGDVLTRFQQATLMYASRKVTLTEACDACGLDPTVLRRILRNRAFNPKFIDADKKTNLLNKEDFFSLRDWMLKVLMAGWRVPDSCVIFYLVILLKNRRQKVIFDNDELLNRASIKWVKDFRVRNEIFPASKDPFDDERKSCDPHLHWLKHRLDFSCDYYNVAPNLIFYLDEMKITFDSRTSFFFEDEHFEVSTGSQLTVLSCVCADGSALEPMLIFPTGNSMPDEQDGRLSTSPNEQLTYLHLTKYIERNIQSAYPLQFTSRSVLILDTQIQDLPFRALEYGFETHTIFLNMMPDVQEKFSMKDQILFGRSASNWKASIMKKLIKSEVPIDCDVLLNSYSSSFKKKATSKAIKESFENSQIFFPLSTLELKRKPSKIPWYTLSREKRDEALHNERGAGSYRQGSINSSLNIQQILQSSSGSREAAPTTYHSKRSRRSLSTVNYADTSISPELLEAVDEAHITSALLRQPASEKYDRKDTYQVGESVYAFWADCYLYKATVLGKVNEDKYQVRYHDGVVKTVEKSLLREYPYDKEKVEIPLSIKESNKTKKGLLEKEPQEQSTSQLKIKKEIVENQEEEDEVDETNKEQVIEEQVPKLIPKTPDLQAVDHQPTTATTSEIRNEPVVEVKKYQVGDIVSCKWTDRRYYGAKILEVLRNGCYRVQYEDRRKKVVKPDWVCDKNSSIEGTIKITKHHKPFVVPTPTSTPAQTPPPSPAVTITPSPSPAPRRGRGRPRIHPLVQQTPVSRVEKPTSPADSSPMPRSIYSPQVDEEAKFSTIEESDKNASPEFMPHHRLVKVPKKRGRKKRRRPVHIYRIHGKGLVQVRHSEKVSEPPKELRPLQADSTSRGLIFSVRSSDVTSFGRHRRRRRHHHVARVRKFGCAFCEDFFAEEHQLLRHIRKTHPFDECQKITSREQRAVMEARRRAVEESAAVEPNQPPIKRGPGRPPGSLNRVKSSKTASIRKIPKMVIDKTGPQLPRPEVVHKSPTTQPVDESTASYENQGGMMVQCDICEVWKQADRESVSRDPLVEKFICSICKKPPRVRKSQQFDWNNEFLAEGKLPTSLTRVTGEHKNAQLAAKLAASVIREVEQIIAKVRALRHMCDKCHAHEGSDVMMFLAHYWNGGISEVTPTEHVSEDILQQISLKSGVPVSELSASGFKRQGARLGVDYLEKIVSDADYKPDLEVLFVDLQLPSNPKDAGIYRRVLIEMFRLHSRHFLNAHCQSILDQCFDRFQSLRQQFQVIRQLNPYQIEFQPSLLEQASEVQRLHRQMKFLHKSFRALEAKTLPPTPTLAPQPSSPPTTSPHLSLSNR